MSLKFPHDAACMVSGCPNRVTHMLSLRMRRKDTGADWAPNLPAYFCTDHADSGAEIMLNYHPTETRKVTTTVSVGFNHVERTTEIR